MKDLKSPLFFVLRSVQASEAQLVADRFQTWFLHRTLQLFKDKTLSSPSMLAFCFAQFSFPVSYEIMAPFPYKSSKNGIKWCLLAFRVLYLF
jgi:hypothetical protein